MTAAAVIFWVALGGVALTYFGYPVLLWLARPLRRRRPTSNGHECSVSLVISAFDEAEVIPAKVENSLALDFPTEKLEVVVISDGSEDGTDAIVDSFADRGVKLFRQWPRRGKSLGLTRFVPGLRGEIVVFSDANSMYEPDAVRKLVRHFADPAVGFVAGHQRYYVDGSDVGESESLYWRYETALKVMESRIGSVVCGDGAIYAIRRELFEPLREDDINDFYLPLRIVARGFRGVFDKEAVCYERTASSFDGEFRRKVRIINRSLRAVTRVPQCLNPFKVGVFAFQLAIHKVLRWFVPFLLLGALAASGYAAAQGERLYQALFVLQVLFYFVAVLRWVPGLGQWKPVYVVYYFCLMNAAAFCGVMSFICGRRITTWQPERAPVAAEQSASA